MEEKGMIRFDNWTPGLPEPEKRKEGGRHMGGGSKSPFWRDYKILIVGAAVFTIYSILLSAWVNYRASKEAHEAMQRAVTSAVATAENHIFDVWGITREEFQEKEKAKAEGKTTPPTDAESFNQYVDREAIAVARVISKLSTEQQKYTEACCMLARVMSPDYPNDFESVAKQPQQWMFYDERNPIRDDDRALALEQLQFWHEGRYPSGLTAEFVYGEWSSDDYVLRDTWEKTYSTNTWRMPE